MNLINCLPSVSVSSHIKPHHLFFLSLSISLSLPLSLSLSLTLSLSLMNGGLEGGLR